MKKITTITMMMLMALQFRAQLTVVSIQSGDWSSTGTWLSGVVPGANDNVIISPSNTVQLNAGTSCKSLSITSGSTLKLDSAVILSLNGDFNNDGNLLTNMASLQFNGTTTQTISGTSTDYIFNLLINNPSDVVLGSDISVRNNLIVNAGTLNTMGNKLTLLSDSNGTAKVFPLTAGTNVTGNITVQRYINSTTMGWRFLGSPVKTTIADWSDDFVTSGFPGSTYPNYYFCSVYGYDETATGTSVNGYYMPTGASDTLYPGVGYWCWLGASPTLVEVTGSLAKFDQNFNVSLTPSAGKAEDGWNMIANPYASPIDWDSPAWTKIGIQNAIYIWDPNMEQYSVYINGVSVNGGTNIIPSSQAFWVQANQNNPVLSCSEEVKVTSDVLLNKTKPKAIIRLALTGNNYNDEMVVCIADNYNNAILPGEDAVKLFSDNNLVPSISSVADSSDLAVNSIKTSAQDITVPVKVKVGLSGVYTISSLAGLNLPSNNCVFLEDKTNGSYFDLRSTNSYTFLINDTTSAPRFVLHISKPLIKAAVNPTCSYKNNGKAIANIKTEGTWNFTWKSTTGNTIASRKKNINSDTLYNLKPGTYFVEVTGKNNLCSGLTETIVIGAVSPVKTKVNVTNPACKGNNTGTIEVVNVNGGTAPYTYQWSDNSYKNRISNLAPGNYSLITRDAWGCSDTGMYSITPISNLGADFKIANDTGKFFTGTSISFINTTNNAAIINWNFGGEFSDEENPVRIYSTAGIYSINLTAYDRSCVSTTQRTIEVVARTNGDNIQTEAKATDVTIYGNDDNAVIRFNLPNEMPGKISVLSADGKLINSKQLLLYKNTEVMPLGNSHGIYLVQVTANGKNYINKLIK